MRKSALFLLAVLLFAHSPANAAGLNEALESAQAAYKAQEFDKAAWNFTQAAEMLLQAKAPDKAQAMLKNAAVCHMKKENYDAAASVYERILSIKAPLSPDEMLRTYNNLAVCQKTLGRQALLIKTLERMLKALPKMQPSDLADVYARLGDAYRALELYAKADKYYGQAEHLLPKDATPAVKGRILTARGLCQGNLGDFTKAAESLRKAKTFAEAAGEPQTLAESDSNLGILYWEQGDYPQSLKLLKTALSEEEKSKLRRNEGVDRNNLGLVQKSMGYAQPAMTCFEEAILIAKEVGNKRDEAIALSNRALLNRIGGNLNDARNDYRAALALYTEAGFQEGRAGALMGIGKIAEREDRNYEVALNNYNEALTIYTKLELPRWQAEALAQIGNVYKTIIQSQSGVRKTRDLVFDDEPTIPKIDSQDALKKCREASVRVLKLAESFGSKEMKWSGLHLMGFVLFREGKLDEAMTSYDKAIGIVTAMRASLRSAELLGEFMSGKEDLYGEAMEVCAALHNKTKDAKYLNKQMQLSETLRNEVQKASAALVRFNFADPKKQALYEQLTILGRQQEKAETAIPAVVELPKDASEDAKALNAIKQEEAKTQKAAVAKIDGDYQKKLEDWKREYPGDAVVFESSSRVNIPDVQKVLGPDQLMIQYISLHDKLIIMAVDNMNINTVTVNVSQKELIDKIKKDFLAKYIEIYGHGKSKKSENEDFKDAINIFKQLNFWLIHPIEKSVAGKKRVYIVTDGFLSQVPFSAIVTDEVDNKPVFFIENHDVSYVRPSFISTLTNGNIKKSVKTLLAIGNPKNMKFTLLGQLKGAEKEIQDANAIIKHDDSLKDIQFQEKASENWLKNQLEKSKYEIIYFATHGMPHTETYFKINKQIRPSIARMEKDPNKAEKVASLKREASFVDEQLPGISPLNSFLLTADSEKEDGFLTIKEILQFSDKNFENTRFVILSACNTGVTFAPSTLADDEMEKKFSAKEVEKELRDKGWVPGQDQVSFVDTFMRRGINNVYGTLWFADDESSAYLMSRTIKTLAGNGENSDLVFAFSEAQRAYINECKNGSKQPIKHKDYVNTVQLHPYYWAVGAVFGK